jgi:hypothetical protein
MSQEENLSRYKTSAVHEHLKSCAGINHFLVGKYIFPQPRPSKVTLPLHTSHLQIETLFSYRTLMIAADLGATSNIPRPKSDDSHAANIPKSFFPSASESKPFGMWNSFVSSGQRDKSLGCVQSKRAKHTSPDRPFAEKKAHMSEAEPRRHAGDNCSDGIELLQLQRSGRTTQLT